MAHVAHGYILRVFHLSHDVQRGLVAVSALDERNLGSRNNQADRNVKLILALAEVKRLQIHGDVGSGKVATHLLGERKFSIFGLLVLKVGRRIVPRSVFQLHIRAIHLDRQVAIRPIAPLVGGVEADNVVRLSVMLHLLKCGPEVVGVEEGLAAGVAAERGQHLLRAEVCAELRGHCRAAVGRASAQAALAGISPGGQRLQATRIDAVDREVGFGGFVGGGAQARLIFNSLSRQPAGKIEHRLTLIDSLERF